jgi:hypothetical protein
VLLMLRPLAGVLGPAAFGVTYDASIAKQSNSRAPPVPLPQVNPLAFCAVTAPTAVLERRASPLIGVCMEPSSLSGRNPP